MGLEFVKAQEKGTSLTLFLTPLHMFHGKPKLCALGRGLTCLHVVHGEAKIFAFGAKFDLLTGLWGLNEVLCCCRSWFTDCVVCWWDGSLMCWFQFLSQGLISGPQNATPGHPNEVLWSRRSRGSLCDLLKGRIVDVSAPDCDTAVDSASKSGPLKATPGN